ncbi:hypothetical protein [Streptomyces sp. BK205]|uniref:hypothetical protein n=1 Tax=Streptomyces sp. BK205 TaxID=2512164 RepID=UPI0010EFA2D5|nr:hypothetical protein [Streptomyces sp. BK205]TCR16063.1 hypothetical protein EV578_115175 [Streptomyces sp. BK205]
MNATWLAAAAWGVAMEVRHVVVPLAHLLTIRRIGQLLAWRESTGAQLTPLWQKTPRGVPPVLARAERRISGRDRYPRTRPFLPLLWRRRDRWLWLRGSHPPGSRRELGRGRWRRDSRLTLVPAR